MMKTNIGFLQERQPDGTVADSMTRLSMPFFFVLLCVYMYFSSQSYENHFNKLVEMASTKPEAIISEQSFIALNQGLKRFDETILLILSCLVVAPKVLQKIFESKMGIKDSSETTETTIKTEKSTTQP